MVESGEPREVHHMALLIGYGAGAIYPYLVHETLGDLIEQGLLTGISPEQAIANYNKAARQGHHQGHVEDGHLHHRRLPRRADLRGGRHPPGRDRALLHLHGLAAWAASAWT